MWCTRHRNLAALVLPVITGHVTLVDQLAIARMCAAQETLLSALVISVVAGVGATVLSRHHEWGAKTHPIATILVGVMAVVMTYLLSMRAILHTSDRQLRDAVHVAQVYSLEGMSIGDIQRDINRGHRHDELISYIEFVVIVYLLRLVFL